MNPNTPISDIVQKQATIGDIINDYIFGLHPQGIAEKYGLDPEKVKAIIAQADAEGKFIPDGVTPEPEASPLAQANAAKKVANVKGTSTTQAHV